GRRAVEEVCPTGGGRVDENGGAWRGCCGYPQLRVSTVPARNIRSADCPLYSREEMVVGVAAAGDRRDQAADGLWHQLRRTSRRGPCGTRPGHHVRSGQRARRGCAPRGAAGGHHVCGFRKRTRLRLSKGKSQTRRLRDRKWSDYLGIPAWHAAFATNFSD